MSDYISRDALSELVGEPIELFLGRLDLKLPPTVDAEPVRHGQWVDYLKEGLKYRCSECGSRFDRPYNYCPRCGAKMDGQEDTGKNL